MIAAPKGLRRMYCLTVVPGASATLKPCCAVPLPLCCCAPDDACCSSRRGTAQPTTNACQNLLEQAAHTCACYAVNTDTEQACLLLKHSLQPISLRATPTVLATFWYLASCGEGGRGSSAHPLQHP